jgi:hypothetical protein
MGPPSWGMVQELTTPHRKRTAEGRRPLGRPTGSWEDNIRTDFRGILCKVWTGCI